MDQEEPRESGTVVDPAEAAESVETYVSDEEPGIRRVRSGRGFSYKGIDGATISNPKTLARIRHPAIPPAYADVWICPNESGHIQATGRDAKGRKQYRYHQRWREVRDSTKFEHMLEFGATLPAVWQRLAADMTLRGLPREKVLATVVSAKQQLRADHLEGPARRYQGSRLRFEFKGENR